MAVIGVLANHKGAVTVMTVASAVDPAELTIHVIGYAEQELPGSLARRIAITGEYAEGDLPALLAKVKPHVVWFPAQWPETYSYTLSAAIDAGLPIVATRIGAFPERLEGRALTWLVDPEASTEEWLAVFAKVRGELARPRKSPAGKPRKPVADYYREHYLRPTAVRVAGPTDRSAPRRSDQRGGDTGTLSRRCAHPMLVYTAAAAARSSGDRRRLRHRAGRSRRGVTVSQLMSSSRSAMRWLISTPPMH